MIIQNLAHEKFIKKIDKINPNRNYEIIGEYKNTKTRLLIKNEYGECLVFPAILIKGGKSSIKAAVNKTEYFINMAREIHGDRYDYSLVNYNGANSKISIICKNHKLFLQQPYNHLSGQGCKICAFEYNLKITTWSKEKFVEKSNLVHNFKYDYSKFIYVNNDTKGIIICPDHGEFVQRVSNHLNGTKCRECANFIISREKGWKDSDWNISSIKSKNFDSFKVYIILCWNDWEKFYKVGKTFRVLEKRFCNKERMPYNYKVIKIFESKTDYKYISNLERNILKYLKEYKYEPKISFHGKYECFSVMDNNTLEKLLWKIC